MNDVLNHRNEEVRDSIVNLQCSSRQGSFFENDSQLLPNASGQMRAKTFRKTKTSHAGRRVGKMR